MKVRTGSMFPLRQPGFTGRSRHSASRARQEPTLPAAGTSEMSLRAPLLWGTRTASATNSIGRRGLLMLGFKGSIFEEMKRQ